jgi:hypothetical protein
MRTVPLALATLVAYGSVVLAGEFSSTYTNIDFQKTCKILEEIEEGESISMLCEGYQDYDIHFAEGDLRHAVRFGFLPDNDNVWQSFGQWNNIGETVEWRLHDTKPVASILRWFITNMDDNGSTDPARRGQVLVISRVGQPKDKQACIIGYVDALANKDANEVARKVADDLSKSFRCGTDTPRYHGTRGSLSGDPS